MPVDWTYSPVAGWRSEPPVGRHGHRHYSPDLDGSRLMTLQPPTPMTLRDRTTWHLGAKEQQVHQQPVRFGDVAVDHADRDK